MRENTSLCCSAPWDELLDTSPSVNGDGLVPLLQRIQQRYGYLPEDIVLEASRRTGIPASRMYGAATFYEQFHLAPRGRHTVKCCRGTACHVKGTAEIAQSLGRLLGVGDGETTGDRRFTFESVACLGTCFLAPVVMVDDDYYGKLTSSKLESILDAYE